MPVLPNGIPDIQKLLDSPSYKIAYKDLDFLASDASRSARLQLEFNKPEWILKEHHIRSTVIVFGSARTRSLETAKKNLAEIESQQKANPNNSDISGQQKKAKKSLEMSQYYEKAREFARIVSEANRLPSQSSVQSRRDFVICTGGGPGIMEAANRGAYEAEAISIGLNIKLPFEQKPNPYITPELCFQFHYFAVRKLHFLLRAKALVVCPGGFGTFDELFEALTLRQTNRMQPIPIIGFGEDFWKRAVNFDYLVESGVISHEDIDLFHFTESPQEAWNMIKSFWGI
ncbi:MAG: LOG family protein [Thermoguttaceae bacterium]